MPVSDENCKELFTGPYYWIPLPGGGWELVSFREKSQGREIGHVHIWPEVLRIIGRKWNKDSEKLVRRMRDYTYALPRGRVVGQGKDRWGIAHGEDAPSGMTLKSVLQRFNLPPDKTKVFFDEHEVVIPEHVHAFEIDFKIELGLKAPPESDFDHI